MVLSELSQSELSIPKLRSAVSNKINSEGRHLGKREVRNAVAEALRELQEKACITLENEVVSISKKGKRRLAKAEPGEAEVVSAKRPRVEREEFASSGEQVRATVTKELWRTGEVAWREGLLDADYLASNPDGITRLFCGNLNRNITEEELRAAIPGIVFVKWVTDKQTREFYGSTFIEMADAGAAARAVLMDKSKLKGRPLKIYYCPPRPGDKWPPAPGKGGDMKVRGFWKAFIALIQVRREDSPADLLGERGLPSQRAVGSCSLGTCLVIETRFSGFHSLFFADNIDDDTVVDFFKSCGELTGLRWMTRQGTEEFRGCGFIEFATSEEADKAIKLDGRELLGRYFTSYL